MKDGPKIGIALGAGGAAAMAEVGVIEELALAGITPSSVAGTSAGAMVGAAYAAGDLDGFRRTMCALTRRRVLRLLDPRWPRTGLLEGRRAMELVRPHVGDRIESLALSYAAVATDLHSGREVVLRRGEVVEAIRASIAIPGIFTPRRLGGRLLVDGGLVNPVPVNVARALGADFVIAVSVLPIDPEREVGLLRPSRTRGRIATQLVSRLLGARRRRGVSDAGITDESERESIDEDLGVIEVILNASRLVESVIADSRLREEPPNFFIRVPLPKTGLFDFHRSEEMVEAGRAEARRVIPELRAAISRAVPIYRRLARWPRRAARVKAR